MKLFGITAILVGGFAFGVSCAQLNIMGVVFGILMIAAGAGAIMSACREEL